MSGQKIAQGVFAIHKPPSKSSAQVIRDAQEHFKQSRLFQPWFEQEQARLDAESRNQQRKRRKWHHSQPLQLKMGHGGTLDPEATGVLILGIGNGTKRLSEFLRCTKSYECVVLFGAATDSYDAVGKVVARKPFGHITKEKVQGALGQFHGDIMQKPPIFSAKRVNGKRMYEYAREGKEIPIEIREIAMRVDELELVEWYDGGTHDYHWPTAEADKEDKDIAEKALQMNNLEEVDKARDEPEDGYVAQEGSTLAGTKRKREEGLSNDETDRAEEQDLKRPHSQSDGDAVAATGASTDDAGASPSTTIQREDSSSAVPPPSERCPAPACLIRMTVTSGFYVRSFCHDLGAALGSVSMMSTLVRTRQGDFQLGKNVLDYTDLAKGEDVWGRKIEGMLEEWNGNG